MIVALTACSDQQPAGQSGLTTAGPAAPSLRPDPAETGTSPGSTPAPGSATTQSGTAQTTATSHTTKKSTPTSPKASPSSSGPDSTDYAVAWSNANCHWFVDSSGKAIVYASEYITASTFVKSQTASVKSTVTSNGGGVPVTSERFFASSLRAGQTPFGMEVSAPEADFASHSITFTATLTFDGLPDYLPDDNTSSLLIHFPTTFQPGSDGDENLVCDHVHL